MRSYRTPIYKTKHTHTHIHANKKLQRHLDAEYIVLRLSSVACECAGLFVYILRSAEASHQPLQLPVD